MREVLCRWSSAASKPWGRLDEAMALHKKEEAICEELGDRSGLGFCYANLGLLYRQQGDGANSTASLKIALAIFTELNMVRQRDALLSLLPESTNSEQV